LIEHQPETVASLRLIGDVPGGDPNLKSLPNKTFEINIYKSPNCDANNYGEGKTYIGSAVVNTSALGGGKCTAKVAGFKAGDAITALAGSGEGTSEFSKCFIAQ